jgi:hypothetical protein
MRRFACSLPFLAVASVSPRPRLAPSSSQVTLFRPAPRARSQPGAVRARVLERVRHELTGVPNPVHRDTRYFSPRTETFWPERWTPEGAEAAKETGEEFNLVQAAYMPFSYGKRFPVCAVHILTCVQAPETALVAYLR